MLLTELFEQSEKPEEIKVRKRVSGYGQLGTKYKKNPKYRDKPRDKKVRNY